MKKKLDLNRIKVIKDNVVEIDSEGLTPEEVSQLCVIAEGRYNTNK